MIKVTTWTDAHRDYTFEVKLFEIYGGTRIIPLSYHWCSYFYIVKDKVTDEVWERVQCEIEKFGNRHYFDYSHHDLLTKIDFHCGITYYGYEFYAEKKEVVAVKVGCDYNHIWDQNIYYTLEQVIEEIKVAIDSFIYLAYGSTQDNKEEGEND